MAIYVVTGGAGFIGSHLADALLADGHELRVLDDLSTGKRAQVPSGASLTQADICDGAALEAVLRGAAGCFHLAAIASVARANADWLGTHRVNLAGSLAVLNACREAQIPLVYASSAAVYGDLGGAVAEEGMACAPQTAYGADKLGTELHAAIGWGVHGVPSFGLRLFNVYGPRQDPNSPYSGVISIFAGRLERGLPLTLHGDGGQTRDFVYVGDVVVHFRAAMAYLRATPGAWISNVCTGQEHSISELARLMARLHGVAPALETAAPRPGDITRSVGSARRATAMLGVSARMGLADGLAKTVVANPRQQGA
jgi:UDP-glucose 4-epimerase